MSDTPANIESPYASSRVEGKVAQRPPSLVPRRWVWVMVAICVVVVVFIRVSNPTGDHAVDNILTLIFAFVAISSLLWWFVRTSAYPRSLRWAGLIVPLAIALVCFGLLRIDHVNGELVPVFRFRWAPQPDALLALPVETPTGELTVDLLTTTDVDYPQFLGPGRDAKVNGVELAQDWDRRPPRLLWRQPIGAGWSAFSAVNGFAVTMEQRGGDELVTCYEIKTGQLAWSRGVKSRHTTTLGGVGPRSTPTIDVGKVYTLGASGTVLCLDGASGQIVWRDNILRRYGVEPPQDGKGVSWGRSGSPLIVDDLLVVPAGGTAVGPHVSLVAFNKHTGELVWEGGHRQVSFSSPILATLGGVRQIISVNQDYVSGHRVDSGEVLWEEEWAGKSTADASVSQPVALPGDRLLLSKGYGVGAAMFEVAASGPGSLLRLLEVWRNPRVLKTKFTNVVIHNGYVFGLSDGILECVRLQDGQRQWKRGRYGHGQLIGVGDFILVQTEAGSVVMIEATPSRFQEVGSLPGLSGKTWNNPCLYGTYLLIRNAEEACCFELASVLSSS